MHTHTDVYAFGILMWEVLHTKAHPYTGLSSKDIVKEVPRGLRPSWRDADAPAAYRCVRALRRAVRE